jgi:membrane-bound lytic murein transglycosylase MltF
MRRLAVERGLDPDKWFNNVEVVTADKIGLETSTYVRNIYKYYTAYKLVLRASAEQRQARELLAPWPREAAPPAAER